MESTGTTASDPRGIPRLLEPLTQARTYLATLDLLLDLVVGTVWFTAFTTLIATGSSLLLTLVGLPILTGTFYLARAAAALERRRASAFLGTKIKTPIRQDPVGDGFLHRLVAPLRDRTTWRELLYVWLIQPAQSVVNFTVAVTVWAMPLWAITLPIYALNHTASAPQLWTGARLDTWQEMLPVVVAGLVGLFLAPWVIRGVAAADAASARWGLGAAEGKRLP
jgi:hypothetical protein